MNIFRTLRGKMIAAFLLLAILPLVVLGAFYFMTASKQQNEKAFDQLSSVSKTKELQIEDHLSDLSNQVVTFSQDRMVVNAMSDFKDAFSSVVNYHLVAETPGESYSSTKTAKYSPEELGWMKDELIKFYTEDFSAKYSAEDGGQKPELTDLYGELNNNSIVLQYLYIGQNEYPAGEKADLDNAGDGSNYSKVHAEYHPLIREYLDKFGYRDILLVDPSTGNVIYSVSKDINYATSLTDGAFADTNLGEVFRAANSSSDPNFIAMTDYARFVPSYNQPASFIASPIYNGSQKVGVLVFEMDLSAINSIMTESVGLGRSEQSYIVGQDKLTRSSSDKAGATVLSPKNKVDTVASTSALSGKSGSGVIVNSKGQKVLSSWVPVTVFQSPDTETQPIKWAVISEVSESDVQAPVRKMGYVILGVLLLVIALVLLVGYLLSKTFTRQLSIIADVFRRVSDGDYKARADVVSGDELGQMAVSLNNTLDLTDSLVEQVQEQSDGTQKSIMKLLEEVSGVAEGDLTQEAEVTEDMTGAIADSFNYMIVELRRIIGDVQDATQNVGSAATDMQAAMENLSQGSDSQADQIIDTTAAIDEMAASIKQVSETATMSSTVAQEAMLSARQGSDAVEKTIQGMDAIREHVQETSKRIKRLGESSQEIGEIVQLISDIADRTSILALNASIQAAMAGEAGRGFAVVAEEVERLAERATESTKRIDTLINSIQTETTEAVTAMEETTQEVVSGSDLATDAGTALSEIEDVSVRLAELIQSITLSAQQQARGSEAVTQSMAEISQITQQTAAGTRQASVTIGELAVLAENLQSSISAFKLPETNGHAKTQTLGTEDVIEEPSPVDEEIDLENLSDM